MTRSVQLKDYQLTLLHGVKATCTIQRPIGKDTAVTSACNRHETRTAGVFQAKHVVAGTEWQTLIEAIVRMNRTVLHQSAKTGLWSSTHKEAYYLTNFFAPAEGLAAAIRSHWHVGNTLHYTRDVTFQEDQSRIRCNPGVFARLRSFGYNILCRDKIRSFNQDRYAAALAGLGALLKWRYS